MNWFDKAKIIIPFTYMWILRRSVGSPKTILDLGCGDGRLMYLLSYQKDWQITGVDIVQKSVKNAESLKIYKQIIRGDILRTVNALLKSKKKFDVVFFSQVIEHISKSKGEKILDVIEKLAKQKIIVGTPKGFMKQPEEYIQGNPYQYHKSGWKLTDFRLRGYKVYGVGFWYAWSENGLARSKNIFISVLLSIISYVLSFPVYIFPSLGAGILAIKKK